MKEIFYQNYIGFDINIASNYFEIHDLIKKKEIKYHFSVIKAKIPLSKKLVEEVKEFIYILLVL